MNLFIQVKIQVHLVIRKNHVMDMNLALEKHFEVVGGRYNMNSIKTFMLSTKIIVSGFSLLATYYKGEEDKRKFMLDFNGYKGTIITSGDKTLFSDGRNQEDLFGLNSSRLIFSESNHFLASLNILESFTKGNKITLSIFQLQEDAKEYYQIRLNSINRDYYYLIDKDDYELKYYQEENKVGKDFNNFIFKENKNFQGLMLPTVLEGQVNDTTFLSFIGDFNLNIRHELINFEINPDLSPEIFSIVS